MGDMEIYLKPTKFFNFNKPIVKEKALEITKNCNSEKEKVKALFYWVRDEIKYNMRLFIPKVINNFKASNVIKKRQGFCVSKSILLSSLVRAIGIPARIHLVDLINHKISQKVIDLMGTNIFYYHGFSEVLLNNKWIKLTPSFDKETAIKQGFLPMCEFDGEHDAVFPPQDIDGNKFGEYIGDRGVHADIPLDEIEKLFEEKYYKYRQFRSGRLQIEDNGDLL